METTWHRIKDTDDTELLPWERQLRVNRFMLEHQVNIQIDKRQKPIYASQAETLEKVDRLMVGPFKLLIDRVEDLELSVYGTNSKTNKLDVLSQ